MCSTNPINVSSILEMTDTARITKAPAARKSSVSLVNAEFFDVVQPPSGSHVKLTNVATRAMRLLHPNTQRALYARLRDNNLKTKKAGSFEVAKLSNGYHVVLSRRPSGVTVEGVFEQDFAVPA